MGQARPHAGGQWVPWEGTSHGNLPEARPAIAGVGAGWALSHQQGTLCEGRAWGHTAGSWPRVARSPGGRHQRWGRGLSIPGAQAPPAYDPGLRCEQGLAEKPHSLVDQTALGQAPYKTLQQDVPRGASLCLISEFWTIFGDGGQAGLGTARRGAGRPLPGLPSAPASLLSADKARPRGHSWGSGCCTALSGCSLSLWHPGHLSFYRVRNVSAGGCGAAPSTRLGTPALASPVRAGTCGAWAGTGGRGPHLEPAHRPAGGLSLGLRPSLQGVHTEWTGDI